MAEEIRTVEYAYVLVKDRAGQGAKVLAALRDAAVNLLAFSGFPAGRQKAQIDMVVQDAQALQRVAKEEGWKLSAIKKGFLIQGDDRIGALAGLVQKLAAARIDIVALDAVSAGSGRFGTILWVKPKAFDRAAKVLGAVAR